MDGVIEMERIGLLYPTMAVENKKSGKIFYKHKSKGDYFLFELDESLIDDSDREKWGLAWAVILHAAASAGIGFFDIEEVTVNAEQAVKDLGITDTEGVDVEGVDVTISLMDHATKEMTTLTVGVSAVAAGCD